VHTFKAEIDGWSVRLLQMRTGRTIAQTFDDLEAEQRDADIIVVRPPVDVQVDPAVTRAHDRNTRLLEVGLVGPVGPEREFARFRDRPVHLLHSFVGEPILSGNINPLVSPVDGLDPTKALDVLRSAELDAIVERSSALMAAPPGTVYQVPSGCAVPHFLRVGNIQCDRDAIDAVFFWLLPHLRRCSAILVDTWSISSIAFHAAAGAQAYFGGGRRRVEMLPGYNDGTAAAAALATSTIERLIDDCGHAPESLDEVLVLISATQTGSLAKHLEGIFKDLSPQLRPRFVTLFALGITDVTALRDLSSDERYRLRPDDDVAERVIIDSKVYFPLAFTEVPYAITKADAERHRAFFDRYAGSGVASVHRDEEVSGRVLRHHHIHVDVSRIVDHPCFKHLLGQRVAHWPTPLVIIAPDTVIGHRFGEIVVEAIQKTGPAPKLVRRDNLFFDARLTQDDTALRLKLIEAHPDDEVIVALDVSSDATRPSQYERDLRTLGYRGRVNYLVGIQRWPNTERWNSFARRLAGRANGDARHRVEAIENVPLPDGDESACPWCAESTLLRQWSEGSLPEYLETRRQRLLKERDGGLRDEIFLTGEKHPALKLGPGSFFVAQEATQAEVYAAAAAALQTLRVTPKGTRPLLGRRRFPLATVIEHDEYLKEKWTDSILRVAIARACHRDELVWPTLSREDERAAALAALLSKVAMPDIDLTMEMLLGVCLGKLPLLGKAALAEWSARSPSPAVAFVLDRIAALGLNGALAHADP